MTLALASLATHLGAGITRDHNGAIRRIIVVNEDFGRGQRLAKIRNDGADRSFLIETRHQNGDPHR